LLQFVPLVFGTVRLLQLRTLAVRFAESGAGEPETTNLTPAFCGTLDYILYSRDLLRCSRLHPLPSVAELTAGGRLGLPTADWPSDHLALKAWLEFA
jgi:mRNA deadenylase 3'-5' endonuclease subunit Ccr4